MKTLVILFICASVACLLLETNADCLNSDGSRTYSTGSEVQKECALYTCNEDGGWVGKACPEMRCGSAQTGFIEQNNDLPYPECCPRPICADS